MFSKLVARMEKLSVNGTEINFIQLVKEHLKFLDSGQLFKIIEYPFLFYIVEIIFERKA